jgi:hypothetical protein
MPKRQRQSGGSKAKRHSSKYGGRGKGQANSSDETEERDAVWLGTVHQVCFIIMVLCWALWPAIRERLDHMLGSHE